MHVLSLTDPIDRPRDVSFAFKRLATRRLPANVKVVDFGINGIDLVYALAERDDEALLWTRRSAAVPPERSMPSNPNYPLTVQTPIRPTCC